MIAPSKIHFVKVPLSFEGDIHAGDETKGANDLLVSELVKISRFAEIARNDSISLITKLLECTKTNRLQLRARKCEIIVYLISLSIGH